jgi:putative pyruvate formate lyase activating enzyme
VPGLAAVSNVCLHLGEEPPISGTRGSGTVFFAGCNLRCIFCQNHQISQNFETEKLRLLNTSELGAELLNLQDLGAHNINFVSPSHMVYQMADAIVYAKARGLKIPIVYNSNGYDSLESLRQVSGLVDIYLPDIKYMEPQLALKFSAAKDYPDQIPGVLREMLSQVGHLQLDADGIATKGLLIRHLVLPGYLNNSKRCLRFVANLSQETFVSIMSQYSPQYKACNDSVINRTLSEVEYQEITEFALDLGLENAFVQELESQEKCLPDFNQAKPFVFD